MYLRPGFSYYTSDGTQRATRGPFLLLASDKENRLYAAVRKVALSQFGHFMMGTARIAGHSVTVSGAYGHDGLPFEYERLPEPVQAKFVPVPWEVAVAFWAGEGGHNSTGSEADAMRAYGLTLLG